MDNRWIRGIAGAGLLWFAPVCVAAAPLVVEVHSVSPEGIGAAIGTIELFEAHNGGLRIEPRLQGLTPGDHGFHIHEVGSCAPAEKDGKLAAAAAAGGHLDSNKVGKHLGPNGRGHEGDLPVLSVDKDGAAKTAVVAPNLNLAAVRGRAIVIHAGGDNYSDTPPLGGGGARVACGVIPQ